MTTSPTLVPVPSSPTFRFNPSEWISASAFATLVNRTPRRIRQMCQTGEILEFSVATYQDDHGRWWVRKSILSGNAETKI